MIVRARVGDAPRRAVVVSEVGEAGNAGERQPDDVEIGAGDLILVIDVGGVQPSMRVAGDEGLAGRRSGAVDGPVVGAGVCVFHPLDGGEGFRHIVRAVQEIAVVLIARRRDDELPRLVSLEQPRGALRAELVDEPRAPRLALEHAHHNVANLERGEAVFRIPPLRSRADERVFDGQRGGGFDEGVDAGGVSLEHVAGVLRKRVPIALDGRRDLEPAHGFIVFQPGLADELRPSSARAGAVAVHMPEPVLGGGETLPEKSVPRGLGADARNPMPVAEDCNRRVRPAQRQLGHGIGNGGRHIVGG